MTRRGDLIYMDHAATTAVAPEVVAAMFPYWSTRYGNASSIHLLGREAGQAVREARQTVAGVLGCTPEEIVFTGCGSESDNLAVRGVAWAARKAGRGSHIVTSTVEHHAVSHTIEALVTEHGFEATFVSVDGRGQVDPQAVANAMRPDTVLVSIMVANNEVGTIQPIAAIGQICRERNVPLHTDAVQAGGWLPLVVDDLKVDLLSLGAHKFYGPKGVGALYVRRGTPLLSTLTGGGQEGGRRAGTENVPYIVGMATALARVQSRREGENARVQTLRERLIEGVLADVPRVYLTGHPTERLPNSASFVVRDVEIEGVLAGLDLEGICASSGSACTSASSAPSAVLTAMGIKPPDVYGHLRLTLGEETTEGEIDRVLEVLPRIVKRTREAAQMTLA